jgi:predicted nuclease of restriction endonuclease-like (RecB) superfamily
MRTPEIRHIACGESGSKEIRHMASGALQDLSLAVEGQDLERGFSPMLGWSHYRALMTIENPAERLFYEVEAEKEGWSVGHLEGQIHSLLFVRLLKSRDKAGVLELARDGHEIRKPTDALKDPYVLDFLDLPDGGPLRESDIEAAIVGQLQSFLLELGKGFAFVARQKRLAYEDEHFYVDLVFYHTILKCYLLIDLKIGKLTHQDIGQMDSYVRLFDDRFTTEGDSPTIGLVLCAEKTEAIARYSVLSENRQIFAAKYVKHLPTEAELQREIERERRLIEARHSADRKGEV